MSSEHVKIEIFAVATDFIWSLVLSVFYHWILDVSVCVCVFYFKINKHWLWHECNVQAWIALDCSTHSFFTFVCLSLHLIKVIKATAGGSSFLRGSTIHKLRFTSLPRLKYKIQCSKITAPSLSQDLPSVLMSDKHLHTCMCIQYVQVHIFGTHIHTFLI